MSANPKNLKEVKEYGEEIASHIKNAESCKHRNNISFMIDAKFFKDNRSNLQKMCFIANDSGNIIKHLKAIQDSLQRDQEDNTIEIAKKVVQFVHDFEMYAHVIQKPVDALDLYHAGTFRLSQKYKYAKDRIVDYDRLNQVLKGLFETYTAIEKDYLVKKKVIEERTARIQDDYRKLIPHLHKLEEMNIPIEEGECQGIEILDALFKQIDVPF